MSEFWLWVQSCLKEYVNLLHQCVYQSLPANIVIGILNHQICCSVLLYMQLCKGFVKMSLIFQLFMQETDDLIVKIKVALAQKNVCDELLFLIYLCFNLITNKLSAFLFFSICHSKCSIMHKTLILVSITWLTFSPQLYYFHVICRHHLPIPQTLQRRRK